jgi:hypothetical protein
MASLPDFQQVLLMLKDNPAEPACRSQLSTTPASSLLPMSQVGCNPTILAQQPQPAGIMLEACCAKLCSLTGMNLCSAGRVLQAGDLGVAVSADGSEVVGTSNTQLANSNGDDASMQPAGINAGSSAPEGSADENLVADTLVAEAAAPGPAPTDAASAFPAATIEPAYAATTEQPVPADPVLESTDNGSVPSTVDNSFLAAPEDTWEATPACSALPNSTTSVLDKSGRLWGWENEASCAYKATSVPLYTYETAPECGPTGTYGDLVQDSMNRLWGYEDGHSCKVRVGLEQTIGKAVYVQNCISSHVVEMQKYVVF